MLIFGAAFKTVVAANPRKLSSGRRLVGDVKAAVAGTHGQRHTPVNIASQRTASKAGKARARRIRYAQRCGIERRTFRRHRIRVVIAHVPGANMKQQRWAQSLIVIKAHGLAADNLDSHKGDRFVETIHAI